MTVPIERERSYGAVNITSPPDGSHVDALQPFSVVANDNNNEKHDVYGMLYPDTLMPHVDYPESTNSPSTESPYEWTLSGFKDSGGLDDGTALYMYVYDTVTGDSDQATYYQKAARADAVHATKQRSANVEVPDIPPTGTRDIPVTVTHPENTKGVVFIILQKTGFPRPCVRHKRLSSSQGTNHNFLQINMDDWDHVWVNVVVKNESGYVAHKVK